MIFESSLVSASLIIHSHTPTRTSHGAVGDYRQLASLSDALYGGLLWLNNRIVVTAGAASRYTSTANAKDGGKRPKFQLFHGFHLLVTIIS